MKHHAVLALAAALLCFASPCWAAWDCDDWVERRGYCVDYVKSRIPTFPIPKSEADIRRLNNREVAHIQRGDVAIFDLGRYWHVAYVENVRRDQRGTPVSIDISEKNYGPRMTAEHFRKTWDPARGSEWKRAVWCGVTKKFGQSGMRNNVPIHTVDQVWTPRPSLLQRIGIAGLLDRVHRFLGGLELFPGQVP